MKVRATTSFGTADASYAPGDEFELPEGADYVRAGLAEPVEPEPKEKAARKKAAKSKAK